MAFDNHFPFIESFKFILRFPINNKFIQNDELKHDIKKCVSITYN